MFKKATKQQLHARICLTGPSGSGKTFSALTLAKGLGGKTAFIDTEHGSARLYADKFDFDVLELEPPFSPERYLEAMKLAGEAGYETLIIDSASHEWSGEGGCLEIRDQLAESKFKGNTWAAFSEVTPRHNRFIEGTVRWPGHIIVCLRSKMDFVIDEKNKPKKVGLAPITRDNVEYEYTIVFDIDRDTHFANASKDRSSMFDKKDPKIITEETGEQILNWLNSGESLEVLLSQDCNEHQNRLMNAATLEELQESFKNAWRWIQANGLESKPYADKIMEAKDKAKDELMPAQEPATPEETENAEALETAHAQENAEPLDTADKPDE